MMLVYLGCVKPMVFSCYIINFWGQKRHSNHRRVTHPRQKIRWNQPNAVTLGTLLWGATPAKSWRFAGRFMLTLPVLKMCFFFKKSHTRFQKKNLYCKKNSWATGLVKCLILKKKNGKNTCSFFWWWSSLLLFLGGNSGPKVLGTDREVPHQYKNKFLKETWKKWVAEMLRFCFRIESNI